LTGIVGKATQVPGASLPSPPNVPGNRDRDSKTIREAFDTQKQKVYENYTQVAAGAPSPFQRIAITSSIR
jgi:hypothetical protein